MSSEKKPKTKYPPEFPRLFKLKVLFTDGREEKYRTNSLDDREKVKKQYKKNYGADEIKNIGESVSIVAVCKKPIGRFFKGVPDWKGAVWGINSDNEYYLADVVTNELKEITKFKKVIKLEEL